jgi:hypothetical protein
VLKQMRPSGAEAEKIARQLRDWVGKEIGPIAKPKDIRFGDNLPKTRSGKIMRRPAALDRRRARRSRRTFSTLENPGILEQLIADAVAVDRARGLSRRRRPVRAAAHRRGQKRGPYLRGPCSIFQGQIGGRLWATAHAVIDGADVAILGSRSEDRADVRVMIATTIGYQSP